MIANIHFLRPWWFLAFIPLLGCIFALWRQAPKLQGWTEICDSHLLKHLVQSKGQNKRAFSLVCLFFSIFFMVISLTGPSWDQLPVSTYKQVQPHVLILDMSDNMMREDLSPNRLSRAKFKLRDLLARKDIGQFALIVYTGEPFVVSPLTDDGQTIAALLPTLTPEIMPVGGQKLETALDEAGRLIKQAGYNQGQVLVLTADTPSLEAIDAAKKLTEDGISSSIMPMRADREVNPLFQRFSNSGNGELLMYSPDANDLAHWINAGNNQQFLESKDDDIPLWRDEGPWFLIPSLILLLPLFRRGWSQRLAL